MTATLSSFCRADWLSVRPEVWLAHLRDVHPMVVSLRSASGKRYWRGDAAVVDPVVSACSVTAPTPLAVITGWSWYRGNGDGCGVGAAEVAVRQLHGVGQRQRLTGASNRRSCQRRQTSLPPSSWSRCSPPYAEDPAASPRPAGGRCAEARTPVTLAVFVLSLRSASVNHSRPATVSRLLLPVWPSSSMVPPKLPMPNGPADSTGASLVPVMVMVIGAPTCVVTVADLRLIGDGQRLALRQPVEVGRFGS